MSENGINSLAECARELRVSPQSISNWKARGWIPPKYEIIINNDFDLKNKNQNKEKKIDNDFIDLESKNNFFSLSNIIDTKNYNLCSQNEDDDWMDKYIDKNYPLYSFFGNDIFLRN